jgi:hypothetical protein
MQNCRKIKTDQKNHQKISRSPIPPQEIAHWAPTKKWKILWGVCRKSQQNEKNNKARQNEKWYNPVMVTKFQLFFPYSILKPLEREKNDPTKNRIKLICVCFNFIAFNRKSLEHWWDGIPQK